MGVFHEVCVLLTCRFGSFGQAFFGTKTRHGPIPAQLDAVAAYDIDRDEADVASFEQALFFGLGLIEFRQFLFQFFERTDAIGPFEPDARRAFL